MTPGDRPAERDRLALTLRELRARTGLSLAALAARTPYSKSSWERYLNGRTLPSRQAVETLCALAEEDPGRPLALWELAESVSSGRAAVSRPPGPEDGPADGPEKAPARTPAPADTPARSTVPPGGTGERPGTGRPARRGVHRALLAGLVVAAAGVAVLLLTLGVLRPARPGGARAAAPTTGTVAPGCHAGTCTGKDPEAYGCGIEPPPETLSRQRFAGRTVLKLRYGAVCAAVWVRIDLGDVGDRVEIRVPRRAPLRAEVRDRLDAEGSLSTPMVAVARTDLAAVRACLVRHGERRCFGPARDPASGG